MASLIGAQMLWGPWSLRNGLPYGSGPLQSWGVFLLATNLGTLFHECGHLAAGWISDMTLRGFQVGPLAGEIRDGRWRFRFVPAGILGGGLVSMVPDHMKHFRSRMVVMVLGGPIASLVTGASAILLALTAKSMPWESAWELLALLGTFGVIDFVVNLIPQRPESHYSDGSQIYQLVTNGPWVARHLAMATVSSSLTTPQRPRGWDPALLQRAADSLRDGREGLHLRLYLAMYYFDNGQTNLGIAAMREALDQDPAATDALDADSFAEMAFYEAALAHDLERAHQWWNRVLAKGDSQKLVDYGKAHSAILCLEGKLDEAASALEQADAAAAKLPRAGVYEYDRWCLDVVRRNLAGANLTRLQDAITEPTLDPERSPLSVSVDAI